MEHNKYITGFSVLGSVEEIFGLVCSGFSSILLGSEVLSSLASSSKVFVEHSGKAGDRTEVVPGCVAHVLIVGLGVHHHGPVGRVWGEHGLVLVGQGALQGKVEGEVLPSGVKSLLSQGEQG